jgi:hypothetical protein
VEDDIVVSTLAAVFPPEPVLELGNSTYQVRRLPRLLYRQVIGGFSLAITVVFSLLKGYCTEAILKIFQNVQIFLLSGLSCKTDFTDLLNFSMNLVDISE